MCICQSVCVCVFYHPSQTNFSKAKLIGPIWQPRYSAPAQTGTLGHVVRVARALKVEMSARCSPSELFFTPQQSEQEAAGPAFSSHHSMKIWRMWRTCSSALSLFITSTWHRKLKLSARALRSSSDGLCFLMPRAPTSTTTAMSGEWSWHVHPSILWFPPSVIPFLWN